MITFELKFEINLEMYIGVKKYILQAYDRTVGYNNYLVIPSSILIISLKLLFSYTNFLRTLCNKLL